MKSGLWLKDWFKRFNAYEPEKRWNQQLNATSRPGFWQKCHECIYDITFAVIGGVSADIEAGFWAADKYARRVVRKRERRALKK